MKKNLLLIGLLSFFAFGCETFVNPELQSAFNTRVNQYIADPKDVLLITAEMEHGYGNVDCTFGGLSGMSSGKFHLPMANIMNLKQTMQGMREAYKIASDSEKEQIILQAQMQSPPFTMSCQSKETDAILRLKAFYSGKQIAESQSTLDYGIVQITTQIPVAESLQE